MYRKRWTWSLPALDVEPVQLTLGGAAAHGADSLVPARILGLAANMLADTVHDFGAPVRSDFAAHARADVRRRRA